MKALPITIFYLLLMALLAYGALNTGLDRLVELKAVQGALEAQRDYHNAWEQTVYMVKKGKILPGRPKPPKVKAGVNKVKAKVKGGDEKKPRAVARPIVYPTKLNFARAGKKDKLEEDYRKVCSKLLQELYGDYPPFQAIPKADEVLIEKLLATLKRTSVDLPEYLATVDLGDLQPLWQKLLLGDDCAPLLDYFYYKPNAKALEINMTWAPEPLLHALVGNREEVEEMLSLQEKLAQAELDEDRSDALERYKALAKVEASPYSKVLKCTFPPNNEILTNSGKGLGGQMKEKKDRF